MKTLLKHKWLFVFILGITFFYWFSARSQYGWGEKYKAEVGADWIVFDEQRNAADFLYPYTFFNPPVNRLGLIQKSSITQVSDRVYKYNKMWADGLVGNSMPTEVFLSFADCQQKLDGGLKDGIEEMNSIDDIEWRKPDDNPYISNEKDKGKLRNTFERICSILEN